MLSGFNTNIRHRTVLFHVQSEDSGRAHPHIITHLSHGGTIIASEKSSYADRVEESDLPLVVKTLMENQHKAVLKRLVAGDFDELIRERLGDAVFGDDAKTAVELDPTPTAPQPMEAVTAPEPAPAEAAESPAPEPAGEPRGFGDGIVSEKPLDEVILGYLVENARKRKRQTK